MAPPNQPDTVPTGSGSTSTPVVPQRHQRDPESDEPDEHSSDGDIEDSPLPASMPASDFNSDSGNLRERESSPDIADSEDDSEGNLEVDLEQNEEEESLDTDREAWEDELELGIQGAKADIKDWATLRKQVKNDLKKNGKKMSVSKINQLMIISNFATLRLKGSSRIQASEEIAKQWHEGTGKWFAHKVRALMRHYQTFEQLPIESRGGFKNSWSFLKDERVKKRSLDYLTAIPTGQVTPKKFHAQLNDTIFPDLGITLKKPLSIRTARRWLIKLGWRHTLVKKGVYMDGHERADVVKYRVEVFLPAIEKFEAWMVHFEGPELRHVEPQLKPGEREIIANFHDESSFHGNEDVRSAWLRVDEQPLRKKGRGRLIHVSAFINAITGQLVLLDKDGDVV